MGRVEVSHQWVVTELDIEAGTIVLGLILDTFRGRPPWYRVPDFLAPPDPARL